MAIGIISPLFPPDTDTVAVYAKHLANTLSQQNNEVAVFTYGNLLPKSTQTITIHAVSRRRTTFNRLWQLTKLLFDERSRLTKLYVFDGFSVGLPSTIIGTLFRIPIYRIFLQDENEDRAHTLVSKSPIIKIITRYLIRTAQQLVLKRSRIIIVHNPYHVQRLTETGISSSKIITALYDLRTFIDPPFPKSSGSAPTTEIDVYAQTAAIKESALNLIRLATIEGLRRHAFSRSLISQALPASAYPASRIEIADCIRGSKKVIIHETCPILHEIIPYCLANKVETQILSEDTKTIITLNDASCLQTLERVLETHYE